MSRWLWPWSNCVKERVCRYLLHHYLGHFFQEHLSLDQLSLDLYKGSVALRDIHLEIWSVNEVLESMESPLELVEGFVGSIEVAVPWAALLTDHCTVRVSGLQLTLQPRQGPGPGTADSQTWASCMTTSLQLAQECLREGLPEPSEPPQPLEGLEMFAQTIETVLRRIKVTFLDTVVRVEHSPGDRKRGVAVEAHVQRLEYCDEAVRDPSQAPPVDVHQPPAFLHKLLQLAGVRLHFEELPAQEETPEPPLQIGSCSGYIELTVKLKQNEAFPGPKLEVAGQLGSLHLLLTPRQLQQLQELLNAMSLTDPEGLADKLNKSRPLGAEDLWLIEQDLNQQLQAGAVVEPLSPDPLTTPLPNLDSTDLFFSMAGLTSSVASVLSELSDVDLASSVHSDLASRRLAAQAHPAGKMAPTPLPDTMRPDSLLKMTLGGVTLTLLQTSAPSSGPPDLATHFFTELDATKDGPFGSRDFHHLRPRFQRACPCSHVRLTGTAVQLSWEVRTGSRSRRTTSTDVHFGQLEVLECLWPRGSSEPEYTEILSFPSNLGSQASTRPCAHLRHTQTLRRVPKSRPRRSVACHCHSELALDLANFQADVELGALDRLAALLRLATTPPGPPAGLLTEPLPATEQQTVFQLSAPQATLRLRFPVADLRPERDPWAGRAVRAEQLRLELNEPQFRSELSSGPGPPAATRLELTCSDLHGTYEDGEKPPVPCLRVSKALDPKSPGRKYFLPQVVVTVNPQASNTQWEAAPEKGEELELSAESPCELQQPEPSPFSSKRTMYETEEMVIPGDPEEMRTFQSRTLALSRCSLEVLLPSAHVFLPSKEVYESVYNRINNDLLMWEPAGLLPTSDPSAHPPGFPGPSGFWHDHFKMCKSAFKLAAWISPDSDSDDEDAHFFSVGASGAPQAPAPEPPGPHSQSTFSTLVTVLKGRITALCETKDEGGRRLEAAHGELVLDVEQGTVFSVSQYRGQPGLGYFCLESEKAALYHRAAVDNYPLPSHLDLPSFTPPAQLAPTIYPSEEGVTERGASGRKGQGQGRGPHMLSTAVRIHLDPHKNVKEFLVTLRLHRATLRHYMALPEQSWHSQLLEFLDVLDDPVLGYLPPTIITVLHTHLFSCAVDYRPLYLPVRVLVTAETFTLSSNIIMDTSTFLLRFILDDSALYLSDKCEVETLDLRRDYVCVLDVDLLELVIKTWKGSIEGKLLSESPASLSSCPPVETALINQRDLADALLDTERSLRELAQPSGGPLPQASPVSVYLFPGERSGAQPPPPPAGDPPGSLGSRTEAKDDEKEEEGDGDTLDSDEFCILDAPGLGIPPRDGEPVVTQLHPGPIVVSFQHEVYPAEPAPGLVAPSQELEERPLSRQVFIVQELEVRDRLASSQINKFLYLHTSERMPRRAHSNMLTIKALHVAPTTDLGGPECCLRVSLMPLRLNVDQDALFFLKDFFTSLAAGINPMVPGETPGDAHPETLRVQPGSPQEGRPEGTESTGSQEATGGHGATSADQQPIYFREFRFTSEVPIWLDYHGKHVTMDQVGTFAGLLIGLAQLNCSELKLKRLCCRHGLLGVDKVLGYALNEWLQDIRKNQLPGLLGGVGPMHSVVQLFQGFRDLLWLPIEQYRKDGRLMRGLQRGAASFGSSTASAALELSNRLVQAIQGWANGSKGTGRRASRFLLVPRGPARHAATPCGSARWFQWGCCYRVRGPAPATEDRRPPPLAGGDPVATPLAQDGEGGRGRPAGCETECTGL
ncbi:autophagy-related protein 2 homolog A [Carlito syrichta]|uniref:Autophagy-related protein 2 homolog A n=1 Tax=Carlito syrichta TaxID=1868482 RepID=A0A3Q0DNS8_CARSF|nr:autophagy-related protein 2 homolog A [Carlito syrichta]